MKHAGIIIIGGAIAAYLLFAGKGQGGSGTGGSLNIPTPSPDALGNYSISGDPYNPGAPSNPSQPFTISDKILAAMTNPFLPNSISFTESALNTKKATDTSVSTFLGGNMPTNTISKVSLPAWMGGETFTENVNKLRGEGYSYTGISPTGEFTFSKKLESAPAPVVSAPTGLYTGAGSNAGNIGYRSSVAARGGSRGGWGV